MKFCLINGEEYEAHNGVGLVEISNISVAQGNFSDEIALFDGVRNVVFKIELN